MHARDTTDGLVRELTECRGREVEVGDLASHATIRHGDLYALAFVWERVYRHFIWIPSNGSRLHVAVTFLPQIGFLFGLPPL
jgi:hypothetical protein